MGQMWLLIGGWNSKGENMVKYAILKISMFKYTLNNFLEIQVHENISPTFASSCIWKYYEKTIAIEFYIFSNG